MSRPVRPLLLTLAFSLSAISVLWWFPRENRSASAGAPADSMVPDPEPESARTAPDLSALPALSRWAERYRTAPAAEQTVLLEEGVRLAKERRTVLAGLIRTDPAAALAAALPRTLRVQLPDQITAELEELISVRAPLEVLQGCLHPEGVAHDPGEDFYRATLIGRREYRVHTYGSRLKDGTLPETSLVGIALDGHMAVSEARYRVLEPGEPLPAGTPALTPDAVAVEVDGAVTVLADSASLAAFDAALRAGEENPVVLAADDGQGASGVTGRPSQAWTHGDKKLLVIRIDFSDLPGVPINKFDGNAQITETYVSDVIHGTNGVRPFYQKGSFGKADLILTPAVADDSPDITPVLRVPGTAASYATAGDNSLLHSDARAAALAAGYDSAAYDRVGVVFTNVGSLPGSKITYGGLGNITGRNFWVNGAFDLRVVAHELGHNWGLHHANLWQVSDGNPVSPSGSSTEYGDTFGMMGSGGGFANEFSHWNKTILHWIPDDAVTTAGISGTYRVYQFDYGLNPGAVAAPRFDSGEGALAVLPRALKVVRNANEDYWIGYRRATASANADNGATVLWGYNQNEAAQLLDMNSPGTGTADAPLALDTTFTDSVAGISLRPVGQGGSGQEEWLDVEVTLQPRLQWEQTSWVVNEQGASAVLTVSRKANATGVVTVNYSTTPGTALAPADFAATSGTLSWADGDMAVKSVIIPVVADALVEGPETFTVTLSAPSGGVVIDPAATVTIVDPGTRDPAFASDFLNNTVNRVLVLPDGKLLVAGAFNTEQDPEFNTYQFGRIVRLKPNGGLDLEFTPGAGANNTIRGMALQPDGKIVIAGSFTEYDGTARNRIARLESDGTLDPSFHPGTGANGTVYAVLALPDGRILAGGSFTDWNGTPREYLAMLDKDGALIPDWTGPDFFSTSGWRVECLNVEPDGDFLVGGVFLFPSGGRRASICRLSPAGVRDLDFNAGGNGAHESGNPGLLLSVLDTAVLRDGKILIAGSFTAFNNIDRRGVARLHANGTLDTDFAPVLDGDGNSLLLLPDSSVLLGGSFTTINGTPAARIARFTAAGVLDTDFAAAGGHASTVEELVLQPDGRVVLGGNFASFQGASPSRPLWRLIPGLSGLPGVIQFASSAGSGIEGTSASLTVTRSGGSLGPLTVGYAAVDGTALAGADYTATTGILTWADGDAAAKTISIPITGDAIPDTPESLIVNLGLPLSDSALLFERTQSTVTVSTAFDAWRASRFSTEELADPAISGEEADPDQDHLTNLTEFALGREPETADATGAVQQTTGTDHLTVSYRQRTPALDLVYEVQTSDDLDDAHWTTNAVPVGAPVPNGDGTETVTWRDPVARSDARRRFLRVHVSRIP